MKRSKAMLCNLILLTVTTLVMRFVGVAFNIFVTDRIGAAGIGLYSLVMSVGGFAVTFAASGVNLAATRMSAAALGRNSDAELRGAMRRCIVYSLCFGVAASLGLNLLARPIALVLLEDARCVKLLRALSISLPFISLSSALNGYFTAVRRVVKTSVAAFFEQGVKIGVCIYTIGALAPKGIEYACLAVILGGAAGEILSFGLTLALYLCDLRRHKVGETPALPALTSRLLGISLPVALSTYVRSGLVTVEHLLIPYGLRRSGNSASRALASYGTLHGMVFPIVLFPQALVGALAGLLVPELSECQARGEDARINSVISRAIQLTMCFSIGTAGIMLCFSEVLGEAIYQSREAGVLIGMLAPLIPVMYLDHVVDGMLKGLGEQLYSMRVNIADAFASVVLVYFLVPVAGIYGYIIIIYAMELVNASLSILRLLSRCEIKIDLSKWIIKPLCCIIGATAIIGGLFNTIPGGVTDARAVAALNITLVCAVYFVLLRVSGALDSGDVRWFRSALK